MIKLLPMMSIFGALAFAFASCTAVVHEGPASTTTAVRSSTTTTPAASTTTTTHTSGGY